MNRAEMEERLAQLPSDARSAALELLDDLTRPLRVREIERLFRAAGHSRSFAAAAAGALKQFDIVAMKEKDTKR